jgi:hypothetical protein
MALLVVVADMENEHLRAASRSFLTSRVEIMKVLPWRWAMAMGHGDRVAEHWKVESPKRTSITPVKRYLGWRGLVKQLPKTS